jgi:hypothetical protein
MRVPPACYQIEQTVAARLPALSPAQARGLAVWVYGAILAKSACQAAVIVAWLADGAKQATIRQYLREVLVDGQDKAAPCRTQIAVGRCFAPLLRWVLAWWTDDARLVLAVDATNRRDELVALVVSVLYRGSAIPVAWRLLPTTPKAPGQVRDSWTTALVEVLRTLRPAIPPRMTVLVLADRGLRSPRLRRTIRRLGMRPLLRLQRTTQVCPVGTTASVRADSLVHPETCPAWAGRATIYKLAHTRVQGTLLVLWEPGQKEPWVLLTDLRPRQLPACWYGLRMWIELGFRALKGVGFHWERTRRTDPARCERHWLVLAVAMLWTLAVGTRAEDADEVGCAPAFLHQPATGVRIAGQPRRYSVFARGWSLLLRQVLRGRLWTRLWLRPEAWPTPPTDRTVVYHRLAPG